MKANKGNFTKSSLALGIAAALCTTTSIAADADDTEVIQVKGIRGSIVAAQSIKRDAVGVVDAISAEDMGKFPDTNLAESLQRITGVSISRENGEGSKVTVRGFGAEYNMITLNGRTMPAGGVYGGGSGAGGTFGGSTRAFDFASLASESVNGVQVYKTGRASIASGGIGATINIETAKPLQNPGFRASVGAKAMHDTTNRTGDDITPELSGLLSWTDDNSEFGISLTSSYQKRDSGTQGIAVNTWNQGIWGQDELYSFADNAVIENAPEDGTLYSRPNDVRYTFSDIQRERTNAQLTMQWAPTEHIVATLDYTFAENEILERRGESTSWLANSSSITKVVFDTNPRLASPLYIEEVSGPRDQGYEQQLRQQTNTLKSLGFNLDLQVTDNLHVKLDYHSSSMDSLPTGPGKSGEIAASIGAPTQMSHWIDYSGDLPLFGMTLDDSDRGNNNGIHDAGDIGSQVVRVFYADQTMDIDQFKFDGSYEFDEGSFDFGIESREMQMNAKQSDRYMAMGDWAIANVGDIPAELFEDFNLADFDDYDASGSFQGGFRGNAEDIAASLVDTYGTEENGYCVCYNPTFSANNTISEKIQAAYAQVNLMGTLAGLDTNLVLGMRYETTEVNSSALITIPAYLTWQDNNDFLIEYGDNEPEIFGLKADYDNFLPSFDFDIAFTDDIKGRVSYSKTIARAKFSDLSSAIGTYSAGGGSTYNGAIPTADAGNPALLPLESDNFDMSLEWYYSDDSYASIGLWEKRVSNFIGTEQVDQTLFDIPDASSGPSVEAAAQALADNGYSIDDTSLFTMLAILQNPGAFPGGAADYDGTLTQAQEVATAYDVIPDANSPLNVFRVSRPINNRSAKIHGLEIASTHFFGDSGFGVQANYTIVRGDVKFDDYADPSVSQFALLGLSDTANLVAIYDKDGLQARIAYNWRDEYLRSSSQGSSRNPVYVEAYSQIDVNVSYDINDHFTVFAEGLNITGEDRRDHGRSKSQIEYLLDLGPRYQVGARYTF
ncbi:TonB-dependent receptor [Catenovulum sp. 2E275]|uniref:TonB-dependent receptor n=1 Tax=Catenovulum sp. 2E275 TaxID=2980497 RepID=UPI0021D1D2B0|nr:TonB-dependent receptor [Catenovulum sp. 2E275]MCU4677113.1 TonB-dependent receptor [Catenovulum sp. 2E275]